MTNDGQWHRPEPGLSILVWFLVATFLAIGAPVWLALAETHPHSEQDTLPPEASNAE